MINAAEGEDRDAPMEGLAGRTRRHTDDQAEGVASLRRKTLSTFKRKIGSWMNAPYQIAIETAELDPALATVPAPLATDHRRRAAEAAGGHSSAASPAHGFVVSVMPRLGRPRSSGLQSRPRPRVRHGPWPRETAAEPPRVSSSRRPISSTGTATR